MSFKQETLEYDYAPDDALRAQVGHHFPWEAEVQMAAPEPRTDPIEHRAVFDWLKRSE